MSWLDLGGGAGTSEGGSLDGLRRFKAGWATGTRQTFLCGRVLQQDAYDSLSAERTAGKTTYFPAYREGELASTSADGTSSGHDVALSSVRRHLRCAFRNKDYRESSRTLVQILRRVAPKARSLLDVGCGTGRHLEHLRGRFHVEGLDSSRQMLAIARKRCPGVRFHPGSLVAFNLIDSST